MAKTAAGFAPTKANACSGRCNRALLEREVRVFMSTDKRYQLGTSTLAIDTVEGKRIAVTVPAEAIIKVLSGSSDGSQLVDVLWEGRMVVMFGIDVRLRGTEIVDQNAAA